jgi:hypothetical protein
MSSQKSDRVTAGDSRLLALSRDACLELLASQSFGRLAVVLSNGAPVIRPVNYIFDRPSQAVVFRTGRGSKFHGLVHATRAAFEIDGIDEATRAGWSVVIEGVVAEVTRPAELGRLDRLGLRPWAPGPKPHWMQIRAYRVSGRRILLSDGAFPGYYLG